MNELQRLEYIQMSKSLKDKGCFSQDEFDLLKKSIICDVPMTFKTSLGDINSAKELVDNNVLTDDEFGLIKKDFLSGREIVNLQTIQEYKGLFDNKLISEKDYVYLKSMLFSGTRKKVKVEELKALKSCVLSEALSYVEYDQLKDASLAGARIPKPKIFTKLNNYHRLCKEPQPVISDEEYCEIKSCILSGGDLPALEEFERLEEYRKLLKDGAINQEDYEKRKDAVLSRVSKSKYQIPLINKKINVSRPDYKHLDSKIEENNLKNEEASTKTKKKKNAARRVAIAFIIVMIGAGAIFSFVAGLKAPNIINQDAQEVVHSTGEVIKNGEFVITVGDLEDALLEKFRIVNPTFEDYTDLDSEVWLKYGAANGDRIVVRTLSDDDKRSRDEVIKCFIMWANNDKDYSPYFSQAVNLVDPSYKVDIASMAIAKSYSELKSKHSNDPSSFATWEMGNVTVFYNQIADAQVCIICDPTMNLQQIADDYLNA